MQLDPNAFQRRAYAQPHPRPHGGPQQLFNPNGPAMRGPVYQPVDNRSRQMEYLERLATTEVRIVEMSASEHDEKEHFRRTLEKLCHEVAAAAEDRLPRVSLECFGSFKSGFATAGSDMDLAIVVEDQLSAGPCFSELEDGLPLLLQKKLLDSGFGARLLSRTRVPIIKVCEKPGTDFLEKLREERAKWDALSVEAKYPHLYLSQNPGGGEEGEQAVEGGAIEAAGDLGAEESHLPSGVEAPQESTALVSVQDAKGNPETAEPGAEPDHPEPESQQETSEASQSNDKHKSKRDDSKTWTRERRAGPLDMPKSGVGIQCDINFFNPLGLHNTQLLRCYSLCDPRVRPMVLFVKSWAKQRKINSSYSGTLSSYGYVMMVLHYLTNVAQPPVLPNLQSPWRPHGFGVAREDEAVMVEGWNVHFWRDEEKIMQAAAARLITTNQEPLGSLLTGFFHYYAGQPGPSFRWMQEVVSLRSPGGLLTKEEKGWVKAVTEEGEGRKVQHRYLFCIEDPFELGHNVARTVTHMGIVAIRDEFRRAKRILMAVGQGRQPHDGELLAALTEAEEVQKISQQPKAKVNAPQDSTAIGLPDHKALRNGQDSHVRDGGSQPTSPKPRLGDAPRGKPSTPRGAAHAASHAPRVAATQHRFDVIDDDSFPTLGAGSQNSSKKRNPARENWSEISGDEARRVLEDVQRRRDEAQAESTAMGAAEAVLGDSD